MCSAMGQQAMVMSQFRREQGTLCKPFQAERVVEAVKKVLG